MIGMESLFECEPAAPPATEQKVPTMHAVEVAARLPDPAGFTQTLAQSGNDCRALRR